MGKKKNFNVEDTLIKIGRLFIKKGYNGTSLEDIVQSTKLLRGSLYATFGNKEGMFVEALKLGLKRDDKELKWGLLMVAMLEVTSRSKRVYNIVQSWYMEHQDEQIAEKLGLELLKNSGIVKKG